MKDLSVQVRACPARQVLGVLKIMALAHQTGAEMLDFTVEEVLRQRIGRCPGQVEQSGHIRIAERLSRKPGADGRQQGIAAVHPLFEDDREAGRQNPRIRRLPGRKKFNMAGQAVFAQVVFRDSAQVAFAGFGLRSAEPPLSEAALTRPRIHQDRQAACHPEEAHGGKQEGLHDLAGLGEAGELASGVMQGL